MYSSFSVARYRRLFCRCMCGGGASSPLLYSPIFFLFCNMGRISRPLELIWAGVFISLAGTTISFEMLGWLVTVLFRCSWQLSWSSSRCESHRIMAWFGSGSIPAYPSRGKWVLARRLAAKKSLQQTGAALLFFETSWVRRGWSCSPPLCLIYID